MNFVKFLRTPFFIKHLWWLLLYIVPCLGAYTWIMPRINIFGHFSSYLKAIVHQRFYDRILLVNNYGSTIGKENLKSYVQYDGNNCFKGFKLCGFRLPAFFYICLNMLFLNILENVIDSIPLWSFFVKTLFVLIWHHYLSRFKNHTSSLTV